MPEAVTGTVLDFMQAFSRKDLPRVMSHFAEDAIMIDPHYPEKTMRGIAAIERGIAWAFQSLVRPEFEIRHLCAGENVLFVEVQANHLFKGGKQARFGEVFAVELAGDGLIKRLQAYPDYGPGGIFGFFLWVKRLF